MKTPLVFLTALLAIVNAFAQKTISNEYPEWKHPIIKKLQAKSPTLIGYAVKNKDRWINIAILDKTTKELYWVTYTGIVADKIVVTDAAYQKLLAKELDPFQYRETLLETGIELVDAAIFKLRFPGTAITYPGINDYDKNVQQVFELQNVKAAKRPLEKLKVLFKERQGYLLGLAQCRARQHYKIVTDTTFVKVLSSNAKGTIMVYGNTDTAKLATFYSPDLLSPVKKAVLNLTASSLSFYTEDELVYDSIKILPKKARRIIDEKIDVFALYQNYNAWRLAQVDSIVKQLAAYEINPAKKNRYIEALLVQNKGNLQQLWFSVFQNQKKYANNLKLLNSISVHYYEQVLKREVSTLNRLTTGEYMESMETIFLGTHTSMAIGNKQYELTDHRGNVVAVITDKKIPHDSNGDGIIDYYTAEVVKVADYSSFGAPLPGRSFEMAEYRYSYNGKEKDAETGYQNYGFRMYDPNIGRFISVDPLTKDFPELTPYQFASNSPIQGVDLDGLELLKVNSSIYQRKYDGSNSLFGKVNHVYTATVVKQNVPGSIKDYAGNWKYDLGAGAVGGYGSDLPGPYFRYGSSEPDFWGKASGAKSTRGIEALSPNIVPGKSSAPANGIAPGASAAQHIGGIASNILNNSVWKGLTKEKDDRSAFYLATNVVNQFLPDNENNGKFKADLTNFLTDGTLPALNPDEMKASLMERKNIMDKGFELMKAGKIKIEQETRDTYNATIKELKKYEDK